MPTDLGFLDYVVEQAGLGAALTYKRLFGEYALYLDGKVVAFACDNSLLLKPSEAATWLAPDLPGRPPYPGAREYPVLDELLVEPGALRRILRATAEALPLPKPKPERAPAKKARPGAPNKTRPTDASVRAYLDAITDPARREDCERLCATMTRLSGEPAVMWGPGIVGFGRYHYRYESGREGDAPRIGFASRKSDLTLYTLCDFDGQPELLAKLGPHRIGKSCLNLKRLDDVDATVLDSLITGALREMARRYPPG